MAERDPLSILTAELPKVAAAIKKLDHPLLELLIGQAQAELAVLAEAAGISASCGKGPCTPLPPEVPTVSE